MSDAEDRRAIVRANNARTLAELLELLERVHGNPLNGGRPPFVIERRWSCTLPNLLFSDREPQTWYAATYETLCATVREATGNTRRINDRTCLQCAVCGLRVRVVDPRNASRVLEQHASTERCFYRAILLSMLWRGYAPAQGAPRKYSEHELFCLGAIDGPGAQRTTRATWAPTPRVLALIALRQRGLDCGRAIVPDDFEQLQNSSDWEPAARIWTSLAIEHHAPDLQSSADVYDLFSRLVVAHQLEQLERRSA